MGKILQRHREFLLYALFGVGTVAIDVGLYSLLVAFIGILWANACGWLGAVLFAFWSNKYFVFPAGHEGVQAFLRAFLEFVTVRLASLLIEVYGVNALVEYGVTETVFGIRGGMAKVIVTVVVIVINYVFSKFLIFRKQEAKA